MNAVKPRGHDILLVGYTGQRAFKISETGQLSLEKLVMINRGLLQLFQLASHSL
jgi:hypothetical protein